MCIHASWCPKEQCSLCTPPVRGIPAVARPAHDTDTILHDAETSLRFDALIAPIGECLVYQNTKGYWGFHVNTTHARNVTTSPARYALSRAGRRATAAQIVKATCGRVGDQHGNGACIKPDHLVTT